MPSELRTGDTVAGFRITSLIGQGAVGSVYLAEDVQHDTHVALKLLSDEVAQDERFRQRFLRESELAASLDHPHVVPTVASGEDDGRLYLAMEYVEGSDLREVLRREGSLEPSRAIDLVGQVAEALDTAHEAGLVHRDVKPGNVLVARQGEGEHVFVCDFGLARHVSSVSSLTGDRGFVGTIDYVSPEQIAGGEIDRRADVYSLACVLFECLAGSRPYERESELSVVFAHLNEPPPRLSDFRPELPHAFDDVFATALAKVPDDRYATCAELVAAARAAFRGETSVRRSRFRRRRILLVGTAVLVAAMAAAGTLLATRDDPSPTPVSITQTAIAGATLGLTESAYKELYGLGWRADVVTAPSFPVLIFQFRRQAIYFDPDTRRANIITTWNKNHRTAAGVGPCSTIEELKSAYGSALKPSRWSTQQGKVYAYTLGKNLLFAASGRPPNPSKFVTAVALYDGDGPRNDGSGVDVQSGTLPFAGFIALNESTCS
jgi:tRNA A-37 threonylcarbamoyl transferase component Bud32